MPGSVKSIEYKAFCGFNDDYDHPIFNTSLKKVILHEGLESIGDDCFRGNRSLKKVIIPKSVKSIGQ